MKKILGLTVVALMVMGLIGGGTWAYFSDVETSTATLAAGRLDLTVDGENPWATAYVSVADMMPADTVNGATIVVQNDGNVIGDLWLRITSVTDGEGPALYDPAGGTSYVCSTEPEYTAEGGPGSWAISDNLSDHLTLACTVNATGVTGINGEAVKDAETNGWQEIAPDMSAGGTINFDLDVTLHQDTANYAQGDNCTFAIEFQLMQDGQSP